MQKEVHEYSHVLTGGMGWGSLAFEPEDEGKGVKPSLNAGSSWLQSWSSSPLRAHFLVAKGSRHIC
ncbi:MAG: hypothetical protein HA489_02600 [Archaeoglobales archaeon]|nr:hypothetical protein [Archaeoglobales archaeon]